MTFVTGGVPHSGPQQFGIYLALEGAFVNDLISKVPGSHLCIQNITIVEWWKMNRRQKKQKAQYKIRDLF